jgi:MFS family permease
MNAYVGLLRSAEVRRLVGASMLARLPTAMLPLSIVLLVVETRGSIAAAGLIAGAFVLGRAAVSPAVGALIDRIGQPRVLLGGATVQGVLLLALVAGAEAHLQPMMVGAVAVATGSASPPVQASLRALWPLVTGEAQRDHAYSFDATSQELIWISGPLIVGAAVAIGSAAIAVIAASVIGWAGVVLFATSSASRRAPHAAGRRFGRGALAVRDLQVLIATSVCAGFAWGALSFAISALAIHFGSRQSSGLLLAALSGGSITGGLLYSSWNWKASVMNRYRALFIAAAALPAPLLAVGSVLIALPAALVAGLPLAPLYGASYVLTGRAAPRNAITEAFTWTSSAFALGVGLGTSAGGVTTEWVGSWSAFALACGAPLAGCALTFLTRLGSPREADIPTGATGPLPPHASG